MSTKLEDLKRLKVPELKSRLKKLGLDSRGLKAELVGRLWSAVDAIIESTQEENPTLLHPHERIRAETVSPPAESHRQYAETGTQTDLGKDMGTEDPQQEEAVKGDVQGKGRAFYEFKEEIKYKRSKLPPASVTEEPMEDNKTVRIDSYNSHLHFGVEPDGVSGHPLLWERFPLLWSGCRLTHGVQRDRVGFEVKLERLLTSQDPPDVESFGLRVGWSVANASFFLGEDYLSFAYDGRGKKVSVGKEEDYGQILSVGDIIGCYVSFSTGGPVELSFHKNGLFLGVAYAFDGSVLQGQPLFPHVLCRGCSVRFLLDPMAPAYNMPSGFTSLGSLADEEKISAFSAPSSKSQCEVIVMVGFPGSGKTHWAKKHIKQHPEKHYKLLSTEELLACTVKSGESDVRLHQASQYLTELIKLAAQRPGNYILDQCNILFSARHYKLQLFVGFRRKVVVIFPTKKEWNNRLSKHQRQEGEHIPEMALLKLQISCTLPQQDDSMEELQFVELSQKQSQTLLQEYKDEARSLLPTPKHNEKKLQRIKKRPYPHGRESSCLSHLPSWSQQYWPVTSLNGYYYNGSYDGCW